MLHPFIIEQIRRREEEERRQRETQQPRVELPLDIYHPARPAREQGEDEEESEGGVTILDLG